MSSNAPQTTDEQRDRLQHISENDDASIANLVAIARPTPYPIQLQMEASS